jgi:hypothetical protein
MHEFNLSDLKDSPNELLREILIYKYDRGDALSDLWHDSIRVAPSVHNLSQHFVRRFCGEDFNPNGEAHVTQEDFEQFLRDKFTEENYNKLTTSYVQAMSTGMTQAISLAINPSSRGIPPNTIGHVPVRTNLDVDIYEEDEKLYLKARFFNIRAASLSEGAGSGNCDDKQEIQTSLPGSIEIRIEFLADHACVTQCKVDTQLLCQLLMASRESISVDEQALKQARVEVFKNLVVKNKYSQPEQIIAAYERTDQWLSNVFYDLIIFRDDEIPQHNVRDRAIIDSLYHYLSLIKFRLSAAYVLDNKAEVEKLLGGMKERLEAADKVLLTYPRWRATTANILTALTVIGGIVMLLKGAYTYRKTRRFDVRLFNPERKAYQNVCKAEALAAPAA